MSRLILASASPRRRELLRALLGDFGVIPSEVPEWMTGDAVDDAIRLAAAKAAAVAANQPGAVVIGSDTIVHDGHHAFGKPAGPEEAVEMWKQLRGKTHRVVTGIAVAVGRRTQTAFSEATVTLANLDDREIRRYIETGRPLDKAGAYAIQDEDVPTVANLGGCYCCVVGLPLWRLRTLLEAAGVACALPSATYDRCNHCPDRP